MNDFSDWCKLYDINPEATVPPAIEIIYPKLYEAIPFIGLSTPMNSENFWKLLQDNLAPLKQDIPDPNSNFDKFLHFLFDNLSVLKPSRIEDCLNFVHLFSSSPLSKFFFVIFPRSLQTVDFFIPQDPTKTSEGSSKPLDIIPTSKKYRPIDPNLYSKSSFNLALQTYYQLIKTKDLLWTQLCNEPGGISTLFGLYLPSLNILGDGEFLPQFWEYRLELSSLMVNLITKYVDFITMANDFILSLNSQLLNLLFSSPEEYSLNFARIIVQLNTISLPRLRPENASRRLVNILNSAPTGTISHNYLLRFVLTTGAPYISPETVISTLLKQGITSSQDLEVLVRFASLKPSLPAKKPTKKPKKTSKTQDQPNSDSQNQNDDNNSSEEEEAADKEPENDQENDNDENTTDANNQADNNEKDNDNTNPDNDNNNINDNNDNNENNENNDNSENNDNNENNDTNETKINENDDTNEKNDTNDKKDIN